MRKILSKSTNPFFNLTYEDELLRYEEKSEDILFLYINEPSVVFGRFQNPWLEFNVSEAIKHNVNIVRRQSGGGTVYHDLGNLNFSFITNKKEIKKKENLQFICDRLATVGLSISINSRSDLILDEHKISGSAFKQTKDGSFHHGTLLVESNLSDLSKILKPKNKDIETKSIPSVRSKVMNLADKKSSINIQNIIAAILGAQFELVSDRDFSTLKQNKFSTHAWTFHETPKFIQTISLNGQTYRLTIKKNIVEEVTPSNNEFLNSLVAREYSSPELISKIECSSLSVNSKKELIDLMG